MKAIIEIEFEEINNVKIKGVPIAENSPLIKATQNTIALYVKATKKFLSQKKIKTSIKSKVEP